MINTKTSDFRMTDFTFDSEMEPPESPMPAEDEVLVYGTEDQIQRLSDGITALNADEKRKAKRKAQRQARKRNRT